MQILITGITGFVGSHLADHILEVSPDDVIYGVKRYRSPLDNIKHIQGKVNLIECDLTDLSSVISLIDRVIPDKVFHLAAQSFVPFSYSAPSHTLTTNIIGTSNLLEAIRLGKQDPLIHICSSSEVYGQPNYTPIDEKHPLQPVSPYGVSKVAEDLLGWSYFKAYGMKTVRTRMFTHTGARRNEVFVCSSLAKQMVEFERGKRHSIEVGNMNSIRTFLDVRDAVRAYWMIEDDMAGEVYNIGGETTMPIREVFHMLERMCSCKPPVIAMMERIRPTDVTLQIPDCSKFKNRTGWKPEISFETTMMSLLEYWRDNI